MGPEYHHEFSRNMNITTDISTMLTCPISQLLKSNSPVTPALPLLSMNLDFLIFWIYLPNWGTTRTATCISHANVHQQRAVSYQYRYKYANYRSHHYNLQEKRKNKGPTRASPMSLRGP